MNEKLNALQWLEKWFPIADIYENNKEKNPLDRKIVCIHQIEKWFRLAGIDEKANAFH